METSVVCLPGPSSSPSDSVSATMRRKLTTSLLSIGVFVLLAASFSFHVSRDFLQPAALNPATLTQPIDRLMNHAVHELPASLRRLQSPLPMDSVLLPDWEVLLLLPLNSSSAAAGGAKLFCLFHTGATSPALPAGPSSFRCSLPNSVRRVRPFYTPRLSRATSAAAPYRGQEDPPREMIRWSTRHTYESLSTAHDVIVFAKSVNHRQGIGRPAAGLRCVFSPVSGGGPVARTIATSSAQEVFRCPHPPAADLSSAVPMRVSLATEPETAPIPTVASYRTPRVQETDSKALPGRARVCACTMVYNVAKFLPEWVAYHAGVGVGRFFLYDNGSEDELDAAVSRLGSEGFNVTTRYWPWPKTQEAGLSHCAAANRDACEWMAFLDVDEFVFSPAWADSDRPDRSMMGSLLAVEPEVGQVSIRCLEFGPSGHRAHPRLGVTQGYTCRRRKEQRHKSVVRLDAIAHSLVNSVHHFRLREGFRTRWAAAGQARVNHYKYQAWDEFKAKFRRRVSTYVADWKETTNLGSRDRAPGLGSEPIEPRGWAGMFCEVNDTLVRDATHKWFSAAGPGGAHRMVWQH
ncbi:unnamed protein product [Musa hybrid cultivar]